MEGPVLVQSVPDRPLSPPPENPPTNIPQDPPAIRQSGRSRQEPQRLNISSWQSKSYDAPATTSSQAVLPGHGPWYPGGMSAYPASNGWVYPVDQL